VLLLLIIHQKVAVDLCEVKKEKYLVIMDYFSKWIEILHMPDTNAERVIGKMKVVFARYGIVEEVVSDNGPPFDSRAMLFNTTAAYSVV